MYIYTLIQYYLIRPKSFQQLFSDVTAVVVRTVEDIALVLGDIVHKKVHVNRDYRPHQAGLPGVFVHSIAGVVQDTPAGPDKIN